MKGHPNNTWEQMKLGHILTGTRLVVFPDDKIVVSDVADLQYAYIIYDKHHRKNVDKIHSFLREKCIFPCGRFGEWEYFNMDHSMNSGKKTAEQVNKIYQKGKC
jgi:UDP-galactopyranose mutase